MKIVAQNTTMQNTENIFNYCYFLYERFIFSIASKAQPCDFCPVSSGHATGLLWFMAQATQGINDLWL